jgi:geranylgeranyl pyrophosphate synthase
MNLEKFLKNFKNNTNKSIKKNIPRNIEYINFKRNKIFDQKYIADKKAIQENIIDMIYNLLDRGGKRWRPALLYLCYKVQGGKDEKLINDFLFIPEIIHSASLIHDDIEDNALIRRGEKCTHLIYGNDCAINTGSLMYFLPSKFILNNNSLTKSQKLKILELYLNELNTIHLGQACDIFWHNQKIYNITYEQYFKMCASKTGVLARFSAKLGCILSNNKNCAQNKILSDFAEKIGIAFQIQDDILDLKSNNEFNKKHGCQDISEGKKTIIIIHTLNNCNLDEKAKLIRILNTKTNTNQEIKYAKKIINKYKSIKFAENKAKEIIIESKNNIQKYISESKYKKLLLEFADYLINRDI